MSATMWAVLTYLSIGIMFGSVSVSIAVQDKRKRVLDWGLRVGLMLYIATMMLFMVTRA